VNSFFMGKYRLFFGKKEDFLKNLEMVIFSGKNGVYLKFFLHYPPC